MASTWTDGSASPTIECRGGLGGADPLERRLVVRTRRVGQRHRGVDRDVGHRQVGQLRIELEPLAERQADDARQLQLRFLEFVDGVAGPLGLRAELHFGAQHVDAGDDAALFQIERLLVQRAGGLLLRARRIGAGRRGERLHEQVARDVDDVVARAADHQLDASTLCASARRC